MSCSHCNAHVQPAVDARSRFCVGCGRRLPPTALLRLQRSRSSAEPALERLR
ncbi:hypothetical protein ACI797_27065 [Geodermatophilus sp. SYSU D00691]